MTTTISTWRYNSIAKILHWVMAVLIIGLICVGWYMTYFEDQPNIGIYFDLHKSFGLIAGFLIMLRIIWRITHQPAPLPTNIALWQVKSSNLIHYLLYLCMVLMPLTGYLGSSYGRGIAFFGWPLPQWFAKNPDWSESLFNVHLITAYVFTTLILLHIAAGLKHALINKDGVFQRMWFSTN
jgi:cytochrome b561